MPRLAIILSSVHDVASLEETLVSVLGNRPRDCEIIVVHRHEYDDPYSLTDEVRFIKAPRRASYAQCANLGLAATDAKIVHLLASGCSVQEGWTDRALAHFGDKRVAAVAVAAYDAAAPERLLSAGLSYGAAGIRRVHRALAHAASDTPATVGTACAYAGFFRKAALAAVGGLPTQVGDLADVDLGCMLRQSGCRAVLEPSARVSVSAAFESPRRGFVAALHAERMFWRNLPLAGWTRSLVCHPWAIAIELATSLPRPSCLTQLFGRLGGLAMMPLALLHHKHLASLAPQAVVLPLEKPAAVKGADAAATQLTGNGKTRRRAG